VCVERACVPVVYQHLTLVAVYYQRKMIGDRAAASPPVLNTHGDYEDWKEDVVVWCSQTDVPKNNQALAIFLKLRGDAKDAASALALSEIVRDDGVDVLLKKLDKFFRCKKTMRRVSVLDELFKLYRKDRCSVSKFIDSFHRVYMKVTEQDIYLSDSVLASLLLSSCRLSEGDMQLVIASVRTITYENMKRVLANIVINPSNTQESRGGKFESEQLVQSAELSPALVSAPTNSGACSKAAAGDVRAQQRRPSGGAARREVNKRDRHGEVSRCFVCSSNLHLSRTCPRRLSKKTEIRKDLMASEIDNSENLSVTMFLGYSNGEAKSGKLNKLVQDCSGHALLDSGCSRTVCGVNWLDDYIGRLTDYDQSCVIESSSDASFTFGDGANVSSLKKVVLPCYIHGQRCELETDVVECNISLLLSKKAMKKGKVCLDFENDTAVIGGKRLKLGVSTAGHYLMPLSL